MSASARFLSPSEAAQSLGVSAKALRLYEQRGLLTPIRTASGWRAYGPSEIACAAEVVALRALGLGIAHIARVLHGDAGGLESALDAHQATLEGRARQLASAINRVRSLRTDLALGHAPLASDVVRLTEPAITRGVTFELPWPWGGERFVLSDIRPINYIIGPVGSGKTRLAIRLAETLPSATFLGLDRLADDGGKARMAIETDPALQAHIHRTLALLVDDGATPSPALIALLAGLELAGPAVVVIDMVEQGLDQASQVALIAHLRRRGPDARPLFLMTRSSSILDLTAVGPDEAIILCPANHSPPTLVEAHPGARGYEAVATCLASPQVRARIAQPPAIAQPITQSQYS